MTTVPVQVNDEKRLQHVLTALAQNSTSIHSKGVAEMGLAVSSTYVHNLT